MDPCFRYCSRSKADRESVRNDCGFEKPTVARLRCDGGAAGNFARLVFDTSRLEVENPGIRLASLYRQRASIFSQWKVSRQGYADELRFICTSRHNLVDAARRRFFFRPTTLRICWSRNILLFDAFRHFSFGASFLWNTMWHSVVSALWIVWHRNILC